MSWPAFIQSEVFWFRLLLLLGAVGITGFGLLAESNGGSPEVMLQRYILSGIWLTVFFFSHISNFLKNNLVSITCWLMFFVHAWSVYWVDLNNYSVESIVGYIITFTGLNLTYLRPRLYYSFLTLSLIATIVLLYTGPEPETNPGLLTFMFCLLWFAFTIISSVIIVSKKKLMDMNENLETLVNERSAQAEVRARQLAMKNQELEQFAFIASHDLKTPLRSIGSFAQLAQRKLGKDLSPEVQEYFAFIHDAVHKMNNLINDILAYSRYGQQNSERSKLKVRELLEECCLMMKPVLAEKNADIEFQVFCEEVVADRVQLQQLFHNLIDNALKYNNSPSAKLTIRVEERPLTWQFSFADNGIGIPEEYHDKVFRIFQRLHNYKEYDGTGIGLALCKRIVENHGGDIWLESGEGQGTVVHFTLAKTLYSHERYLLPANVAN
jgi:signal transduction histidine kinase